MSQSRPVVLVAWLVLVAAARGQSSQGAMKRVGPAAARLRLGDEKMLHEVYFRAISADGAQVASIEPDYSAVLVRELATGRVRRCVFPVTADDLAFCDFSHDGKKLLVADRTSFYVAEIGADKARPTWELPISTLSASPGSRVLEILSGCGGSTPRAAVLPCASLISAPRKANRS